MGNQALGVFRFDSIGPGLLALNTLDLSQGLKLLEASPLGAQGFWILLQGESQQLEDFQRGLTTNQFAQEALVLGEVDPRLTECLYSLHAGTITDELTVIETDNLSSLFSLCHHALQKGADLFEFKIDRGARKRHSAIVTGTRLQGIITQESTEHTLITHIEQLSESLKAYFSPQGIS